MEITLQAAQEMSWCGVTYQVKPPENAKYVSTCRYTRNNFYGFQQQAYDSAIESLMEEDKEELYSTEYPYMRNCNLFEPLSTPIEEVMLFSTVPETKPDRAGAYFFCWFDADKKPISISYFIETVDRIVLEPETESYLTEVDVKHPVKGPVFIDGKNTGWKLRAEYHVQSGYNAYIVDLHIEDSHGNPIDLKEELGEGEKIVFYLPYREHEDFSKYEFFLTHYEGGNLNRGVSVDVMPTDKGIRFEVDNLSPFVVSWEELTFHQEPLDEENAILIEAFARSMAPEADGIFSFNGVLRMADQQTQPDPETGYLAYLQYPAGTNHSEYRFRVFHKIDDNLYEELECTPTTEGIAVRFFSLSPIAIAYEKRPASSIPQTGDATPLWLYVSILTLSAGCILILRRKHA